VNTLKAPERIETSRLVLRKPTLADSAGVFTRYASDPEVTRYLGWPRHQSLDHTNAFLGFSDAEWSHWPAGPYLIESRSEHKLLGSTGLAFEAPSTAATGYVLARDAWGKGYATEALAAIVDIADGLGVLLVYALCHPENPASARVLEKCGFRLEQRLEQFAKFPNLNPGCRETCLRYVRGEAVLDDHTVPTDSAE
jgi:[ribosomal protein S5]-alanine N-acetyltransferase